MAKRLAARLPVLLVSLLLFQLHATPAAAQSRAKWTVFVYMLADNDLEQFGLLDMEEMMRGMAAEPLQGCVYSDCNEACPTGTVATYSTDCTEGNANSGKRSRCCPADSYPDVMVLVDRGTGQPTQLFNDVEHADYSLLHNGWTTAKELLVMPGGQWQQLTDRGEINMADSEGAMLADFLRSGLERFPPSADRHYMLVMWDHGSGWSGYGVDHTCSSVSTYSTTYGCNILSIQTIAKGLADGLKDPATGAAIMLDIIGFDACLMAMYEISSALAPYSKYLLASELLEPGHGWDYAAPLQGIIQRKRTTPTGTQAVASLATKDVADWVIQGYMDQAVQYTTSGLTMALIDLSFVGGPMESNITSLSTYLSSRLKPATGGSPGYAVELLRKRAALSTISGAEDNVDLGALLTGFAGLAASAFPMMSALVATASSVYNSSIVSYNKDAELRDVGKLGLERASTINAADLQGTGMAIYFPSDVDQLDGTYRTSMVAYDGAALNAWMTFLDDLYVATGLATSGAGKFEFVETYAVPYLARSTNTWITHGTLSNYMGLTASLMYGFRTPSGTQFITAGSTEAAIVEKSAVGVWSGYLFGLLQDLVEGDNAIDGLALGYADEQRVTNIQGEVVQLIMQVKVYYASHCYAASADMKRGIIKYVFDTQSDTNKMQLFVSSSGGTWGEIPNAQGGVIIPYLGSYNLTSMKVGTSFGYSDCLKWGYNDTIQLAAFDSVQAADILGLDLTRDMETQLLVKSIDGDAAVIPGYFGPAQKKTQAGCQCSQSYTYNSSAGTEARAYGTCVNPSSAAQAWCVIEPDSCAGAPANANYDYCLPTTTLSGCKCHPNWSLKGTTYYGSCADDNTDPRGAWCVVDKTTCPGTHRAHEFDASHKINVTTNGVTVTLTGQDFDYCQVTTVNKCHCRNVWSYGGATYHGTCRQGLKPGASNPGNAETSWCFIDLDCKGSGFIDGQRYDVCTAKGGRVTTTGKQCQLPATYNGVVMYDCLEYNQTSNARVDPWCFTNQTTTDTGICAPWSCSADVKQHCAAGNAATATDLTPWASSDCLQSLCNARQALVNVSQCASDAPADMALLNSTYRILSASASFGQLLKSTHGPNIGSLAAYCDSRFGQLCVDEIIDKECPGLFRNNNTWWLSRDSTELCQQGCLTALCRLQEQAKARVKGAPNGWQDTVATASRGFATPLSWCMDASLENLVRWMLMQEMDTTCGWSVPTNLQCDRLLSPPQLCAASTDLMQLSGTISDGVPDNGTYAASSSCSWTIDMPDQPYITLNFTKFDTEEPYDVVTVEDFDGVIGMFSGKELPGSISTDTGLIKLQFTSDSTKEGRGFAATYVASASPQMKFPTCTGTSKLIQAVLRTRQYSSELSWLVTIRNTLVSTLNTPSQLNIVMAGGLLPSTLKNKVPDRVATVADAEYKDYRSYYSYACLPIGTYNLNLYDSYGDGWDNGRITLTQMVNVSTGCELLYETTTAADKTVPFSVTADADTNSAACASLAQQSLLNPYYVDAGLVIKNEDPNTFIQAKQRKIKEALALLLDVDASQISIRSIASATADDILTARFPAAAATRGASTAIGSGGAGDGSNNGNTPNTDAVTRKARRAILQSTADVPLKNAGAGSDGKYDSNLPGTIQHMIQQGQQQHQQQFGSTPMSAASVSSRRRQLLAELAVPVSKLMADGVYSTNWQLLATQLLQRQKQQDWAGSVADGLGGLKQQQAEQSAPEVDSGCASESSGRETACAADDDDASTDNTADPSTTTARKLQQLVVLDGEGSWQQSDAVGADHDTNSSFEATDVVTALAGQPLADPMQGFNSTVSPLDATLSALLGPQKAITGPKPAANKNGRKVAKISLPISFRDAFTSKPKAYSNDLQPYFGISSIGSSGNLAAEAPKPGSENLGTGNVAAGAPKPGSENLGVVSMPTTAAVAAAQQPEVASNAVSGTELLVPLFAAERPARSLLAGLGGAQSGVHKFVDQPMHIQPSTVAQHHSQHGQHNQQQQKHKAIPLEGTTAGAGPGRMDSQGAAELVQFIEGELYTSGSARPRPRPVHQHGRHVLAAAQPDSSDSKAEAPAGTQTAAAGLDHSRRSSAQPAKTAAADPLQRSQGVVSKRMSNGGKQRRHKKSRTNLLGTDRPLKRKPQQQLNPTAIHDVPQDSWQVQGIRSSSSGRLLLATNATSASKGVVVIARVSGYRTEAAADATASVIEQIVTNGTLRKTLAAKGWADVDVGLTHTEVGMRVGPWEGSTLRIIVIACAAGGGVLVVAAIVGTLWVRRARAHGAAQVPGSGAFSSPPRQTMGPGGYTGVQGGSPGSNQRPAGSYTAPQQGRHSPVGGVAYPASQQSSYLSQAGPQGQGRSRSSSMPLAVPAMGDGSSAFAARGKSMVSASANPFAAGIAVNGGSSWSNASGQDGRNASAPISPNSQPVIELDNATRGWSYTSQQQQQQQKQQYYSQQQQQQYYHQQQQAFSSVERFSPPLQPHAGSFTGPNYPHGQPQQPTFRR